MNCRQTLLRRSEQVLQELDSLARDIDNARTHFAVDSQLTPPIEMTSKDFDRIARVISNAIRRIEELKFEAERLREDRRSFSQFTKVVSDE